MTAVTDLMRSPGAPSRPALLFPHNLLISTMPKAGTHFLCGIVENVLARQALPLRKSDVSLIEMLNTVAEKLDVRSFLFYGHFRFQRRHLFGRNWRVLTLVRDPRDVLLSLRDYLTRGTTLEHRAFYATIMDLSIDEQLKVLIEGDTRAGYRVGASHEHCDGWTQWEQRGGLCLRYETLMEPESIAALAAWLGVPTEPVAEAAARRYRTNSDSFNVGETDRWRTQMSDDVRDFFREKSHGIVERLGYEW